MAQNWFNRLLLPNRLLAQAMDRCEQSFVIARVDRPGNPMVYVNPAFSDLTGYHREEMLGRPCSLLQRGDSDQEAIATMRRAIRRREPCEVTLRNYRKDGSLFWNRVHLSPLKLYGQSIYYLGQQIDVSQSVRQSRELQKQLKFVANLADHVPGVIYQFRMDPEGRMSFPYISEKVEELYGVTAQEAVAEPRRLFESVLVQDLKPLEESIWASFRQGTPWSFQYRIRRPDGSIRWVSAQSVPEYQSDGTCLWSGLLLDHTRTKRAEQALGRAKREAERAAAARSELVANVSHEFRTPLAGMLGCLDMLDQGVSEAQQKRLREQMRASASLLNGMISGLLDEAQIGSRHLVIHRESFSPRDLVEDSVASVRVLAENKGLVLSHRVDEHLPPRFFGDSARIGQILLNLLGNAIKYTEQGQIEVSVDAQQGDELWRLAFSVADTGPGIDPVEQERIFGRYQRGDENPANPGLGLGLDIIRPIARELGGDIRVESVQGEGSCFTLSLALPADLAPAADTARSPIAPLSKKESCTGEEVLLVEDDSILGQIARFHLNNMGCRVTWVCDGAGALEAAHSQEFALILMDLRLPDGNGVDIIRRIRRLPRGEQPTAVALTAHADASTMQACRRAGMDGHLTKPYTAEELEAVIRECRRAAR